MLDCNEKDLTRLEEGLLYPQMPRIRMQALMLLERLEAREEGRRNGDLKSGFFTESEVMVEVVYVVVAGKYETFNGAIEENIKYVSEEYSSLDEAENDLGGCYSYPFAYIDTIFKH